MSAQLQEFFRLVEDYYGVSYRKTMKGAIEKLLRNVPHGYLPVLFRYLRMNVSADYSHAPDEKAIRECMAEVDEAYPEFRVAAHNQIPRTFAQISDDAGAIPAELGRQYITDILTAFREDRIRPMNDVVCRGDNVRMTPYEFEQQWKEAHGIA